MSGSRVGREVRYAVRPAALNTTARWMTALATDWDRRQRNALQRDAPFTIMAAFAELERDIIHQRTMAGLAAARAEGRRVGGCNSLFALV